MHTTCTCISHAHTPHEHEHDLHTRSVLLSKSTGELVFGVLACPSEAGPTLTNYASYLIGCATLAAIPLQIIWVNKGLMYFEVRGNMSAGGKLPRASTAYASMQLAPHTSRRPPPLPPLPTPPTPPTPPAPPPPPQPSPPPPVLSQVQLIMPIFASGTVIITVLGGSIFFQEFRSFCTWQYIAYFFGLVPPACGKSPAPIHTAPWRRLLHISQGAAPQF